MLIWVAISPLVIMGLILSLVPLFLWFLILVIIKWIQSCNWYINKTEESQFDFDELVLTRVYNWIYPTIIKKSLLNILLSWGIQLLIFLFLLFISFIFSKNEETKTIFEIMGNLFVKFSWTKITIIFLDIILYSVLCYFLKIYFKKM